MVGSGNYNNDMWVMVKLREVTKVRQLEIIVYIYIQKGLMKKRIEDSLKYC